MFEYTCPWTGITKTIFPTSHPDNYRVGFFWCESLSYRRQYQNPSEAVEWHEFQLWWAKEWRKSARRPDDIKNWDDKIAHHQQCIEHYKSNEYQREQATHLLAHRATYFHKLTPRDQQLVAEANRALHKILENNPG